MRIIYSIILSSFVFLIQPAYSSEPLLKNSISFIDEYNGNNIIGSVIEEFNKEIEKQQKITLDKINKDKNKTLQELSAIAKQFDSLTEARKEQDAESYHRNYINKSSLILKSFEKNFINVDDKLSDLFLDSFKKELGDFKFGEIDAKKASIMINQIMQNFNRIDKKEIFSDFLNYYKDTLSDDDIMYDKNLANTFDSYLMNVFNNYYKEIDSATIGPISFFYTGK